MLVDLLPHSAPAKPGYADIVNGSDLPHSAPAGMVIGLSDSQT